MNLRLSIDAVLLFLLLPPFASDMPIFRLSNSHSIQTQGSSPVVGSVPMSDREKAGLHGPVRTCVDETIDPRGGKSTITTEYGPDGRLLISRRTYSDGSEWIRTQTYDSGGRVAKIVSGKIDEIGVESLYSCDESGRLLTLTNHPQKGGRIDFQYDDHGLKTTIQSFDPETLHRAQSTGYVGSPWDAAIHAGVGVPVGGKIVTTYDESDRPTEVQIRDEVEQVVSRMSALTTQTVY